MVKWHVVCNMAKESITLELTEVMTSKSATNVLEKRFVSLNGFDTALRKGARLLVFSGNMREETRTRNGNTFKVQFFWALDLERNKMVKVSRSGLTGGMGYASLPKPGIWGLNEDRTWYILRPQVNDDEAKASFRAWGMSRVLPGAFEYSDKKISVPKCFLLKVDSIQYLYGRNPIDASLPSPDLTDSSFHEDAARMWAGTAEYPTRELIDEAVAHYDQCHSEHFTDDMKLELLK